MAARAVQPRRARFEAKKKGPYRGYPFFVLRRLETEGNLQPRVIGVQYNGTGLGPLGGLLGSEGVAAHAGDEP